MGSEEDILMTTKKTRLSMSGNSHPVQIPRKFQLSGNTQIVHPQKLSWATLMDSLKKFSADFLEQRRRQPAIQKR
jgi:virulence-associated protein VagC